MRKEIIKYIFYGIDVLIVVIAIYLIYKGYFSWGILIRAIIMLIIFSIYRWIGEWLGLPSLRKDPFKSRNFEQFMEKIWKRRKEIEEKGKFYKFHTELFYFITEKKFSERYYILDIIFYMVYYYNPFNWHWIMIQWIWVKMYYMKVWINGNKDILIKKYFNKDATKWFVFQIIKEKDMIIEEKKKELHEKYKYRIWTLKIIEIIFRYTIKYPFLRIIIFYPHIKEKILQRYWLEFFKIRFIGITYTIIFAFYGLYDYYNNLSWIWIIVIIYVYFAIIWPGLSYLGYRRYNKVVNLNIIHPSFILIFPLLIESTITYKFLSIYCNRLRRSGENFILENHKIYNDDNYILDAEFYYLYKYENKFEENMLIDNFWVYEKVYSIPMLLYYYELKLYWMNFFHKELYYFEGKRLYGVKEFNKVMKEYIEKDKDLMRVISYIFMDCRRYLGIDINNGKFINFIGDDIIQKSWEEDKYINYYKGLLYKRLDYNNIKEEYYSTKNYKIFIELLCFIKAFKNDKIFNIISSNIQRDYLNTGTHFGYIESKHKNEIIVELANKGREAKTSYKERYKKLSEKEKSLGNEFVFLSLEEIEKFKEKWKGKDIDFEVIKNLIELKDKW